MELDVEDDGPEWARLDAIETVLGLMVMQMQRDGAHDLIDEIRKLARAARRAADIPSDTPQALDRLAGLLEQWARMPPKLRTAPAGAKPASDDDR